MSWSWGLKVSKTRWVKHCLSSVFLSWVPWWELREGSGTQAHQSSLRLGREGFIGDDQNDLLNVVGAHIHTSLILRWAWKEVLNKMFQNIGGGWLAKLSLLFVEVFLDEGRELYDYYKHSSPRSWRPSRSCTRTSRWRSWGLMWMESCWSLRSPVLSKLPSTKFWEALKLYFWPVKFVLIIFVKLSFTFSSTRIKSNNVSEFEAPHQSNVATLAFVRFWRLRVYWGQRAWWWQSLYLVKKQLLSASSTSGLWPFMRATRSMERV